ncbi:GntP family gluconate:H+ symporter [Clostridium tetanomorphum]|uniref:GntP family permease n=2 Tax=Clostridium TaxID=1485 RepID=A0A923E9B1_CLOTT|nr:SLC13 family permease [Clostridium tetanomorphum]KAJ50260.1 GntP family permease [Clostridium tetanomorphum DSM 665]MBC2396183.1 GntP family permease [Clostridium tetanomorphum]MBP1864401.1 GntP family gluconate:H+ symporter [Clostridium tetanomorphum]NRS83847.1 GntP family gluconate:H+ symporter [Clostridium tetanomorphum]NRZ97034.1 GntP family gluconate:H+ symporter [Clostridium tetanomorphum]
MHVTAFGALIGLILAIVLIIKKVHPAYGLIIGAVVGGLVGGAGVATTVTLMINGAKGIIPAVLRILTAGVLAGVLIESGAAAKIAETIVDKLGESNSLIALSMATLVLTSVGVFVDVAVITVAPIALAIGKRANITKTGILIAMIGGGKAGNIMSPNPNAIAASDSFKTPLTSVMAAGIIPAIAGLIVTCIISKKLAHKGSNITQDEIQATSEEKPNFLPAIAGPLAAIIMLSLRPLFNISIDPLVALPVGGIIGTLCMGKIKNINKYATAGLGKMSGVAILLLGTGTLAGIISNSGLKDVIINGLNTLGLPAFALAPVAGILMSGATASTTSGTAVASQVFGPTILQLGVKPLAGAAMIHSGATVLDHLPHGSFFHATGGSVFMNMKERLKLISYESLVGLSMTIVSTIIFGFIFK